MALYLCQENSKAHPRGLLSLVQTALMHPLMVFGLISALRGGARVIYSI
ncbi:MAG: hypothetical protein A4E47_01288 [Methanosaeta sp. PtaU1.Bin028]|nr:MAG: hypothetical protein A4E47_01288 [Methanosaeta sp. PtaU1.Bin028]